MLDTICDVLKKAYERNWISTRDGNASYRRKNESFIYVTPSGTRKYLLNSEMIIKIDIKTLQRASDEYQNRIIGLEPTGELELHLLLQQNITDNRIVLHLHPTFIIAAMYAGYDLQKIASEFPEINRYTRVGPIVPEIPPISKELALASINAFELKENGEVNYDIIGLKQHGVVIIAKDAWTAYEHCERLEHICQIVLASKSKL
jgi:ribulose-5-phosphate 4-epimerase/fuculose-1-phosphate aldolase